MSATRSSCASPSRRSRKRRADAGRVPYHLYVTRPSTVLPSP
ncbi:Uncharacterised protein [Bordetella pertussis]|nr:Uncharacterised protein [Bordetella pertussis]